MTTNYSTEIHRPANPGDTMGTPTFKVAHCQVCGVQWVIQGGAEGLYPERMGCDFCDAPAKAITIKSEKLTYSN